MKAKKKAGRPPKAKNEKYVYIGFRVHPLHAKRHGGLNKARAKAKKFLEEGD